MRPKNKTKYPFILEELENSRAGTRILVRPMFGSHAVYLDEKIIFILRKKNDPRTIRDDGMWVASLPEHSDSLRHEFPELRPIELFKDRGQKGFTGWLNLPDTEDRFEENAIAICGLVIGEDPRIGKVPKPRAESLKKKSAKTMTRKHRRK